MKVNFDESLTEGYRSHSQIARVLTENWVAENMYCPRCGCKHIFHFENNRPVADFYCPHCHNEFELKSKDGTLKHKISDGAYAAMIKRITSNDNPDFFFMSYCKEELRVKDFIFIPKYFFVPDVIEKRNPLKDTAKRAGWVGCNILLDKIPAQGRIPIIENGVILNADSVLNKVSKSQKLELPHLHNRGWLMDILNCVNRTEGEIFALRDVYRFEDELQAKYPLNNNIKAKIRQQLQFLRDRGFLDFLGNGMYRKLE